VLDRIAKESGVVRGWVNNACRSGASLLGSLNRKSVEYTVQFTLSDVMLSSEAAADRIKGQGGALVNIASMYGLVSPQPKTYDNPSGLPQPARLRCSKAETDPIHTLGDLPLGNGRNPS